MNFLRIISKRSQHLKIVSPFLPLISRCSEKVLNGDSSLAVRSYCCQKKLSFITPFSIIKRFKYKKTTKEEEFNEEFSDDEDEDQSDSKLVIGHVLSLRMDAILKTGLGMARNKIETYFYESKIRVNGKKILKKSHKVKVGDEIDIIKGKNAMNESLLNISRVVLVSVKETEDGDKLKVKLRRYKTLSVEDYSEPWNLKGE